MRCFDGCPMDIATVGADTGTQGRSFVLHGVRMKICGRCGDVLPVMRSRRRMGERQDEAGRRIRSYAKLHMRMQGYDQESEVDWPD
jgi:hypothetical protein